MGRRKTRVANKVSKSINFGPSTEYLIKNCFFNVRIYDFENAWVEVKICKKTCHNNFYSFTNCAFEDILTNPLFHSVASLSKPTCKTYIILLRITLHRHSVCRLRPITGSEWFMIIGHRYVFLNIYYILLYSR